MGFPQLPLLLCRFTEELLKSPFLDAVSAPCGKESASSHAPLFPVRLADEDHVCEPFSLPNSSSRSCSLAPSNASHSTSSTPSVHIMRVYFLVSVFVLVSKRAYAGFFPITADLEPGQQRILHAHTWSAASTFTPHLSSISRICLIIPTDWIALIDDPMFLRIALRTAHQTVSRDHPRSALHWAAGAQPSHVS